MTLFPTLSKGATDLGTGFANSDLWMYMGWKDIGQRYRRTVLGPWWLAIGTGVMVVALGFLWSDIFKVDVRGFMPFFAIGYVLWVFLSGAIVESCTGFTQFDGIIKQRRTPFSSFLYRIGVRHSVVLAHNAAIIPLILIWAGTPLTVGALLAIPGLMVFILTVVFAAIPIAIFCTRFRDFPQIVTNVLQVAFFATPIMWRPDVLKEFPWIANFNPVARLIDIVRLPLLGIDPGQGSWIWSIATLILAFLAAAFLLGRYSRRIAYWL
jgi:ABC-type polysaccharide/polyol phosphate export permease